MLCSPDRNTREWQGVRSELISRRPTERGGGKNIFDLELKSDSWTHPSNSLFPLPLSVAGMKAKSATIPASWTLGQ